MSPGALNELAKAKGFILVSDAGRGLFWLDGQSHLPQLNPATERLAFSSVEAVGFLVPQHDRPGLVNSEAIETGTRAPKARRSVH